MKELDNVTKGKSSMTKERKELLDKVVAKAFKDNKAVFERLDEI